MSSPFPGMDPYLEGSLWPDVHHNLASKIQRILIPLIRPKYVARIEKYVIEDNEPEQEIGVMYPDVEVFLNNKVEEASPIYRGASKWQTATFSTPIALPTTIKIPVVEIRDTDKNRLITAIEMLSPINKRQPNLTAYRKKRQRLYQGGVHLIEIDLLRRGTRPMPHPRLKQTDYVVTLTRSNSTRIEFWTMTIQDALPIIPIPLALKEEVVPLNLQQALAETYQEMAYDLSIDYHQTPPPPNFSQADIEWIKTKIAATQ